MMTTMQETPEVSWSQVYGVEWTNDPESPFVEYTDLAEARAVAEAAHGLVLVKYIGMTDWGAAVICPRCRTGYHERCSGGTWCDCQHAPRGNKTFTVMTDKRDECGCHRECTSLPHECGKPCIWPGCLTAGEREELAREIVEGE